MLDITKKAATPLNASPEQLDALGIGEIAHLDHYDASGRMVRNEFEHPEQAFRRGMQQGAHRVYHALEKLLEAKHGTVELDHTLLRRISDYVHLELFDFRYPYRKGNRLRRRLGDAAPWLDLVNGKQRRR